MSTDIAVDVSDAARPCIPGGETIESNPDTSPSGLSQDGTETPISGDFLVNQGTSGLEKTDTLQPLKSTSTQMAPTQSDRAVSEPPVAVKEPSEVTIVGDSGGHGLKDETLGAQSLKLNLPQQKQTIALRHFMGPEFMLPYDDCRTWKDMQNAIKLTYEKMNNARAAKKEIDKGDYLLYTVLGGRVLPDHWDILVMPGWVVVVQLKSQFPKIPGPPRPGGPLGLPTRPGAISDDSSSSDSDEESEEEGPEDTYTTEVSYTVSYYKRPRYPNDDDTFMFSKSYDEPVVLKRSKYRSKGKLPVLEEKTVVTVANSKERQNLGADLEHEPILADEDVVKETRLHIHSPLLLNALRSITKYTFHKPPPNLGDGLSNGIFEHPYENLFYHRKELLEYKQQTTGSRANHTPEYNAECDRHIDFLLQYLEREPKTHIKSVEAKWAKKVPVTTFADLWLLMKPGSDVYVREHGQLNAYVIERALSIYPKQHSMGKKSNFPVGYDLEMWNLKFDGKFITRAPRTIYVPVFDGEREITSLPVIPVRFRDETDGGKRKKELIERGKKVFHYSKGPAFLEYTGRGLRPGWRKYNRSRVILEHESHPWNRPEFKDLKEWHLNDLDDLDDDLTIGRGARGPRCECSSCTDLDRVSQANVFETFRDYDDIDAKEESGLTDHQYMLCMSHMYAFILKDRTYDILDVSGLVDANIVEDAIDRLVMRPEANKATIKAIVETHMEGSQEHHFSADFIQGKGEGQIFLLHGPPGTGKTLTAESVAEYTRRPLLSITAADLGHEPVQLENNLLRFFKDASNWDAIVLLDEADIYLERRSINDLRRNSIVSIFLRALDYFQGILFLTTNRVGHFDEAFMSRIHVSIGYERLDDMARETIWENLFRKLKEDHKNGGPEIRYEYEAKQYVKKSDEIKKLQWNGREIRNAFQTAVALATFDAKVAKNRGASEEDCIPEIKEKHLSQVAGMSAAFKDYITDTHQGIEDADMAYKLGNRLDRPTDSPRTPRR